MGEHGFTLSVCVPETVEEIDGITCMKIFGAWILVTSVMRGNAPYPLSSNIHSHFCSFVL